MADRKLEEILGLGRPKPEAAPVELESEGPQDVGPCGWVWASGCHALDVERGAGDPVLSFQYYALGVVAEFAPGRFWVEFGLEKVWRVTVEGRDLRPLFDRLNDHRLRRLRQGTRDFDDDGKPFVTKVTIAEVIPEKASVVAE